MNLSAIRQAARAKKQEREKAEAAARVAQMVMSGDQMRARDAELTRPAFRGSFMPKLRPARPQSFGSAQSYEIFDDDDEVEPDVPEDDDELPLWSCSGCRAGDHGNSSSHTKQPGCRLYQELPNEKPTPEAEKIEKLRRMREQMSPGLHAASPGSTAGQGKRQGDATPSAQPDPSAPPEELPSNTQRNLFREELRSMLREELRDIVREEMRAVEGVEEDEAGGASAQPRATSTTRAPQPVINVHVPPQKVEVTATIEKDENKIGGEVDKFKLDKLRFQPDAVEENPAKLQKWITRMKIAVSGVGGDLAESMVDQCLVAAQVYQLQYRSLPEDEREDVEVPLAELTRGQHRCHERYIKPILERLLDDVVLEAEDRGRERARWREAEAGRHLRDLVP